MHNVFTSIVDSKESIQPFKDYTLREQEIALLERCNTRKRSGRASNTTVEEQVPKRLRGEALELVRKLQKLHSQCSYYDLLKHYCPCKLTNSTQRTALNRRRAVAAEAAKSTLGKLDSQVVPGPSSSPSTDASALQNQPKCPETPLVLLATPPSDVSAFCQAVLSNLIPNRFWGEGIQGQDNKIIIMRNIDSFVRLRRFESLSLHTVSQGLKVRFSNDRSSTQAETCR